jgi:RING finger protein 113A
LFNRADKVIEKMNKKRKEKEDANALENNDDEGGKVQIEGLREDSEDQEDEDEDED